MDSTSQLLLAHLLEDVDAPRHPGLEVGLHILALHGVEPLELLAVSI